MALDYSCIVQTGTVALRQLVFRADKPVEFRGLNGQTVRCISPSGPYFKSSPLIGASRVMRLGPFPARFS